VGQASAEDTMRRLVAAQAETVTRHGGEGGTAEPTLCPIDELVCQLCDGSPFQPEAPQTGWAGSQGRAKSRTKSVRQLHFCLLAGHLLTDAGYESLRGQEASKLMLEWGTPCFAQQYPKAPEAAASASGRPHLPCTAQLSASELTPLLMEKRVALENRIAKGRKKELTPPQTRRSRGGGRKRTAAANGGAAAAAPKRPRADATAVLCSARRKLADAFWDIEVAVRGSGSSRRRSECLSVPELKALVADRGWKLAQRVNANQASLLALALAKRDETRRAAAAAQGRPDDPMTDDGEDECWGHRAGDYQPVSHAPASGEQGTEQAEQQPGSSSTWGAVLAACGHDAGADSVTHPSGHEEEDELQEEWWDAPMDDGEDDHDAEDDAAGDAEDEDVVRDRDGDGLSASNSDSSSDNDCEGEEEEPTDQPEHASNSSSSDDDE
jgi:hypothetical protein